MSKLWAGRTSGAINEAAEAFNASISFDKRLYREDIEGSIAHVVMLGKQGIVTAEEASTLAAALGGILSDIENGTLAIDESAEDIHSFVEATLVARVGTVGKKLHTARSRNDQVALDMKLFARKAVKSLREKVLSLVEALIAQAEKYKAAVMSGYTHLQRAQPVTFGHHLMAYVFMLLRDADRLADASKRLNLAPIGAAALAGTTYPTDRAYEAAALGFDAPTENSLDSVSDRDYIVEILADLSLLMTHLSRFSEELVLWSSFEFKYVELSDDFTTGSSIMPQKKNPDMAELARGKTGRVYGDLITMLTVLKGLPLAYNKDMQEDKECFFDALDTVNACLDVFIPMVSTMRANEANMLAAAKEGYINATDLADYITKKGVPFRTAYGIVGEIVRDAIASGRALEDIPLEKYKKYCEVFGPDLYDEISIANCVNKRTSYGGTAVSSVEHQIAVAREAIRRG